MILSRWSVEDKSPLALVGGRCNLSELDISGEGW